VLEFALAFAAGVLTVAAPCILPMLPLILGASVGRSDPWRPVFIVLGFVLAFTVAAAGLTLFAGALGLSPGALRTTAAVLLALFGLLMIWPKALAILTAPLAGLVGRAGAIGHRAGAGPLGGLVLGMTLGLVWTPCAGPVLGSILTLAATARDPAKAAILLAAYALGAGLPMLLIAYGGQYVTTRVRGLARWSRRLQQAFGVLIILTALAIQLQYDVVVSAWLGGLYPSARTGL
jgi:cytochrome c biogenesis protein CcdA